MKKRKFCHTALPIFLLTVLSVLLLSNTQAAMDGIRRGLTLCAQTVIPALFPFLVLSELIVSSGVGETLGRMLGKPLSALLGISQNAASAVLLGVLCGQPISSVTALAFLRQKELEEKELQRISLFANNPSSGFLIGAVGVALFGNKQAGVALFCITTLSALLVALGLRFFGGKIVQNEKKPPNGARKTLSFSDLTDSVKRAFRTLLQICAFLLFFCALGNVLGELFAALAFPAVFRVLVFGILEMTCGVSYAVTALPARAAFRCTAFFCGFAGLSVCMQIFSLTEGHSPPFTAYFLAKLVQGALNLLLCEIYLRLFDPALSPATSIPTFFTSRGVGISHYILCALILLSVAAYSVKKREKGT
ncbi:MAG: hypothetical protein E7624_03180 [Ruminococcaceae bacterium]|nr:hypothetical protein [Oscillospiraceae bacterium]